MLSNVSFRRKERSRLWSGLSGSVAARLCSPAAVLILVLGFASLVRLAHLGTDSFAHDEAFRANWQYDGHLGQMRRFPPLQLALGWTLQHTLGRAEWLLRVPYALSGVVCVYVLFLIGKTYIHVWAGLLAAALAAGHPVLVMYSRNIKVFGLEAMMTALLVWAGLAVCRERSSRAVMRFVLLGLLGLGLTFSASLIVVAWMPVLGWICLQKQACEGGLKRIFLSGIVLLLAAGGGWYWWLSGVEGREWMVHYYRHTEPVWPPAYTAGALARWVLDSGYGALQYVLGISHCWLPLNWVVGTALLIAVAASVGVLWDRARGLCVMVVLLTAGTYLAGALCLWPFGNLRHVTFLTPLVCLAAGSGLWRMSQSLGKSWAMVMLIALCVGVPAARAAKRSVIAPPLSEHVRPVFEYVAAHKQPGDAMFAYYFLKHALQYYWHDETMPVLLQPGDDRGNTAAFAARFDEWIQRHGRVWFVFAHDWQDERRAWITHLKKQYELLDEFESVDASAHLFGLPVGQ